MLGFLIVSLLVAQSDQNELVYWAKAGFPGETRGGAVEVVQIVNDGKVLGRLTPRTDPDEMVMIDMPSAAMVDDKVYSLPGPIQLVGTESYTSVSGARRTVPHYRLIDRKELDAHIDKLKSEGYRLWIQEPFKTDPEGLKRYVVGALIGADSKEFVVQPFSKPPVASAAVLASREGGLVNDDPEYVVARLKEVRQSGQHVSPNAVRQEKAKQNVKRNAKKRASK